MCFLLLHEGRCYKLLILEESDEFREKKKLGFKKHLNGLQKIINLENIWALAEYNSYN